MPGILKDENVLTLFITPPRSVGPRKATPRPAFPPRDFKNQILFLSKKSILCPQLVGPRRRPTAHNTLLDNDSIQLHSTSKEGTRTHPPEGDWGGDPPHLHETVPGNGKGDLGNGDVQTYLLR
jgi:hypothetical protein